jgi:hypothetical protein
VNFQTATVQSNNSPAFGQSKTESATGFPTRKKGVEDFFVNFCGDSRSIVGHSNLRPIRLLGWWLIALTARF